MTFSLKAATLSAAALIATPYAFAYDMAAVTIPAAFLASDQLRCGSLKGEKTIMITMFGALVAALLTLRDPPDGVTFGGIPVGPVVVIMILGLTFRRVFQELRSSDGQGAPLTKPRLPAASHSR